MILEKTKFSISKLLVNPQWQLKNTQKKFSAEIFGILNVYYPKSHLIKALYSLDSPRSNGRLSQNLKTGGFRELFLLENNFKTCLAVNFQKNIQILEAWKTTKNMKFDLNFFSHALLRMNSI